jgi:hypothetical protein
MLLDCALRSMLLNPATVSRLSAAIACDRMCVALWSTVQLRFPQRQYPLNSALAPLYLSRHGLRDRILLADC